MKRISIIAVILILAGCTGAQHYNPQADEQLTVGKVQAEIRIGMAGGEKKCQFLRELGCDETLDYKNEDVAARLPELFPDGIDVYFDNVGGDTLSACLENLAFGARIVLCGSISEYLLDEPYGLQVGAMVFMVILWFVLYVFGRAGRRKGKPQMNQLYSFMSNTLNLDGT